MKRYPKISRLTYKVNKRIQIYAFDKLDGSNFRAEWSRKNGFYKYGSRKRLLDESDELLGESIQLFENKYMRDLDKLFRKCRFMKAIGFFEVFGAESFAGYHNSSLSDIVLLDINYDKKGIIPPREFVKLTKNLDTPKILYIGKINSILINLVQDGKLEGMTFEGVVCKGELTRPGLPYMCKIKNKAWIKRLKDFCKDNEELFNELL